MAHTEAEITAFVDRCQALVADGDDDEFQWRMHMILRWWLGQAWHSCAGDERMLMQIIGAALESIAVHTVVIQRTSEEPTH